MSKNIINIDQSKCIGCGICAKTCHQSAIEIINGKATVTGASSCDGLGRCLPVCPVNAISFLGPEHSVQSHQPLNIGCSNSFTDYSTSTAGNLLEDVEMGSALTHWPVQIKLVPTTAPYFNNCHLLIAADCVAFAYSNFHKEFMEDKITLIGCPKLDNTDYAVKLGEIISSNNVASVTVVRMEVPCCTGIATATQKAVEASGKQIKVKVVTISTKGKIL